jgi:hypothetical protein
MQYNVVDRNDALNSAWEMANVVYKKTNKIPMKKIQFISHLDIAYMLGCSNTAKDIYHYLKTNPNADYDTLIGDLQMIIEKSWNNMLENPIGKETVNKISIEDIMEDKHINLLLKK